MRSIRLDLKPRTFEDLSQLGRSIIPAVAPQWTDHNTHDPGIMLVELLAWIAEAQMYGIARTRKDERLAFARLVGLSERGPQPASGLIWADVRSPAPWPAGHVVERGTTVTPEQPEAPTFVTTDAIELTTARLTSVASEHDGRRVDWTRSNARDGATFMPFGSAPAPGDRLLLEFTGPLTGKADGGVISIGVQIAGASETHTTAGRRPVSRLIASLTTADGERRLRIVKDTTDGLLRSGVLLLRIPGQLPAADTQPVIALRSATGGFLRAPRIQQIAPNVLPVEQVTYVREQRTFGNGLPDQTYTLKEKGLIFPFDHRPLVVTIYDGQQRAAWTRKDNFDDSTPGDSHFTVDTLVGTLQFGNGINGRVVPAGSSLEVEYSICLGERGNQPPNLTWKVIGISGTFGTNLVGVFGGMESRGLAALRRLARQRIQVARPIVTSADLEDAALAFTDLGVQRAAELRARAGCRIRGARLLVIVGPHEATDEVRAESNELLSEVRARLAPRLPLGQRLEVIGPRYVTIRLRIAVVAAARVNPDELQRAVVRELQSRLAITPRDAHQGWPFGRDVTAATIGGWIRKLEGVGRVLQVRLIGDGAASDGTLIALGPASLPVLDISGSHIQIERPAVVTTRSSEARP